MDLHRLLDSQLVTSHYVLNIISLIMSHTYSTSYNILYTVQVTIYYIYIYIVTLYIV